MLELKEIRSPADLKELSLENLNALATQLREAIVNQVAHRGGHLASSLGVVELTLAMHVVYDTPHDIIIWDVGHQAYAHKLLTGRFEDFRSIRQHDGISGFLKRSESEYDAFGAGHASTSISAALGFAVARDIRKEERSVLAVIGDGSLTGGMAFEAMNNAAHARENMTIVLNDNKMSIAPNVGSLSKYLNRVITDPTYRKIRDDFFDIAGRLPAGGRLAQVVGTIQDAAKHVLLPGRFFEDLGIRYFGPVDGHDVKQLLEIFRAVKKIPGPCLVHVLTNKGHGWDKSQEDAYKWHASVPFEKKSGKPLAKPSDLPSLTKIFGQAFLELARQDKKLVGITGAMPSGCGLDIAEKEIPEQIYDVGIAEQHAVTFAAGLACGGIVPVCAIYSTFLQRAIDQVIHDVALQDLHVVFVLDRGGLVGADGPTHHGSFDLTYMRMIPGMVLMAPIDQDELRDMFYTAVKKVKGPVALRYPRGNALALAKEGFDEVPIGIPRIMEEGDGILVLGLGVMFHEAKRAVDILREKGHKPTLVDPRFVRPLDPASYRKLFSSHHTIVTLEDNVLTGGFGSGVGELIHSLGFHDRCLLSFGHPDIFVTHGNVDRLFQEIGIDGQSVAESVLKALGADHG